MLRRLSHRWWHRNARQRMLKLEKLESRATPAIFPFTVSMPAFHVFEDPDPDPNPFGDDEGDYYAIVKIGSNPEQFGPIVNHGETLKEVDWSFTANVDTAAGNVVQVNIFLMDDDDSLFGVRGDDDEIDINPSASALGITLFVDLTTGQWTGDAPYPADSSTGDDDDEEGAERGRLFFDIDSDSDGLNNRWELIGLDPDRNGSIDLTLPGANPARRDLFVEVDAMAGRAPVALPPIINVTPSAPIVVTSNFHGLSTGTRVTLAGVTGSGAIGSLNNTYTVTRLSNNTFQLNDTNGSGGAYFGGGTWSLANLAGTGLATGTSLDLAIDAFWRAPVPNPDGSTGITLHVERDELSLPLVPWTNDADGDGQSPFGEDANADGVLNPGEDGNGNNVLDNGDGNDQGGATMYTRLRTSNFGTPTQRGNAATMQAKALTHRYGPFVDRKVDSNGDKKGVTVGSSGMSYSASSFMISMGAWSTPGGLNDQQAGTFMHELGHSLGLGHGGSDGTNNKPNYYSLMNYTWQVPEGGDANMQASWRMDYSIGNFPSLNEMALNESAGIGGVAGRFVRIGPTIPDGSGGTTTRVVPQTGPVDWNNANSDNFGTNSDDGDNNPGSDNPFPADINFDATTGGTQTDFNDWANLKYGIAIAQAGFSKPDDLHFTFEQFLDQTDSLVYQSPAGNGTDNLTLRKSGDFLELVNDASGAVLIRRPFAGTIYVNITGANFEEDRLTIDYGGGNPVPSGGVQFDGGAGSTDTLALAGTLPGAPRYVPSPNAGPESGQLQIGGGVVNFTGLEFVRPVNPEITAFNFGPATINENDQVSLAGKFLDPGSLSSHSITIHWGDGTVEGPLSLPAGARSFSATHRYLDDNPSGTAADNYSVTFTLTDNDNLTATRSSTVVVNNVAPVPQNLAVTPAIDENGSVTLSGQIVDPGTLDTFTLVVDWGEGTPQTFTYPAGTTQFSETHQYLDDNPTDTPQDTYHIGLTLSDDDTGTASAALETLVHNVAPVITAFTSDAVECGDKTEGDTVNVIGSFTDIGTFDTHTAVIDWGDNSPPVPATIAESGGSGTIAGSHIYSSGGIFRIVVTLTDDDTGQTTDRTFALITGVGILNGQLQVVGTKADDDVHINLTGNGTFQAHASFIADSPRSLPSAGVTSIAMILCEGDDRATVAGNIDLATYINGEEGNDVLNGGRGPNVLLGGEGDDDIRGGHGHDILVGGSGSDRIVGNMGRDILIAGEVGGSSDPIDQLDELLELLAEWALYLDPVRTRPRLVVTGDDDADKLTGSADADWFFYDLGEDHATDAKDELFDPVG